MVWIRYLRPDLSLVGTRYALGSIEAPKGWVIERRRGRFSWAIDAETGVVEAEDPALALRLVEAKLGLPPCPIVDAEK